MKKRLILFLTSIVILSFTCRGPVGQIGPSSSESLIDPNIQPKVIFTNPPMNSKGPYDGYQYILIRFNKIMDLSSLREAIHLFSLYDQIAINTEVYSDEGDIVKVYAFTPDYYGGDIIDGVGHVFKLTIESSAKDINGNYLQTAFSMTFEPEPYFRVRSIWPKNDATEIPLSAGSSNYIRITFNSAINDSILELIKISPVLTSQWRLADSITVVNSYSNLNINTTYTINISSAAHDKYGNYLSEAFNSSFTTKRFQVSTITPSNGSKDIRLDANVYVRMTGKIDTSTIRAAFQINPMVDGYFTLYMNADYFYFFPKIELLPETNYTVTIDSTIRSISGNKLLSPYIFKFSTAPFKVSSTSPTDGASEVSRASDIYVYFNAGIKSDIVPTAFGITGGVTGTFSIHDTYFSFKPNSILSAYTTYTVLISTLMESKGAAHLKVPYTFSFTAGD
jgi:hypothetical protein